MKLSPWNMILTAIALGVGWLALLSYLWPLPALLTPLLGWGGLLAAVAVLAGVWNLLRVHLTRLFGQPGGWYSLFVVAGFMAAFVVVFLASDSGQSVLPQTAVTEWLMTPIITPVSASLSALLLFVLTLAGMRVLKRPLTLANGAFLAATLLALLTMAPALAGTPDAVRNFGADAWALLSQVLAVGGGRGLMLGIALGIIATGLRVLLAMDRPYGD